MAIQENLNSFLDQQLKEQAVASYYKLVLEMKMEVRYY